LVIRHSYLWWREFEDGQDEGRKDRPAVIVLATPAIEGGTRVYVLPVTHSPPHDPRVAMEIPPRVKDHLALDSERSWVVLDEFNDFIWPGYDVRGIPGSEPVRFDYGMLPPRLFAAIRDAVLDQARKHRLRRVPRD
jgi:hypothetical protein